MRTRIKVCGITRVEDAVAAAHLGADAIGMVFWSGSARFVNFDQARRIGSAVGPFVSTVGVFVDPSSEEVAAALDAECCSVLQFHGREAPSFCNAFGRPWLKAFRVGKGVDLIESIEPYKNAAGWMFDTWDVRLAGGTGETFDWNLLPKTMLRPLLLSGGLTPENVGIAIRKLRPWAVDVSSGVESDKGVKDVSKIAAFIAGVRNADQ
ncbi:MAG: phosphoribosylanthranilate isomerase [Betaproteobacteria bacterium]|nr:phosphoribosylanthranilate isomerase [Betaproteobacteria bacterium]